MPFVLGRDRLGQLCCVHKRKRTLQSAGMHWQPTYVGVGNESRCDRKLHGWQHQRVLRQYPNLSAGAQTNSASATLPCPPRHGWYCFSLKSTLQPLSTAKSDLSAGSRALLWENSPVMAAEPEEQWTPEELVDDFANKPQCIRLKKGLAKHHTLCRITFDNVASQAYLSRLCLGPKLLAVTFATRHAILFRLHMVETRTSIIHGIIDRLRTFPFLQHQLNHSFSLRCYIYRYRKELQYTMYENCKIYCWIQEHLLQYYNQIPAILYLSQFPRFVSQQNAWWQCSVNKYIFCSCCNYMW